MLFVFRVSLEKSNISPTRKQYFRPMLGLKLATEPAWANVAEKSLHDILNDHAYCEQKAATTCISLIVQYADKEELVDQLTPVVAEEWGHFRKVLKEMKKRGIKLERQRRDEYVNQLLGLMRKGGTYEDQLTERLLVCAMIEARSCERFRALSLHCAEADLRTFYHEFMVSEAGHYRMFMDLAELYAPREKVRARWQQLLVEEAAIIESLGYRADRVH